MALCTAYSDNTIIHPALTFDKLNAMDTVRHMGTDRTYRRFIKTDAALRKLGIEWCGTEEWLLGRFAVSAQKTYGD